MESRSVYLSCSLTIATTSILGSVNLLSTIWWPWSSPFLAAIAGIYGCTDQVCHFFSLSGVSGVLPWPDLSIACNHQYVCLHWPGASFRFCLSDESEVMPCQPDLSIVDVDDCTDQVCHSDFFCHRCYFWPKQPDLVSVATLGQIYQSCCEWLSPSSIAIIDIVDSYQVLEVEQVYYTWVLG